MRDNQLIPFDKIKQTTNNREYWSARELRKILGYTRWDGFMDVINKAKTSFNKARITENEDINNHFRQVVKMVKIGSGSVRETLDYQLSRYACYLIAQNSDPRKRPVALAQAYFNIQTRRQELSDAEQKDINRLNLRKDFAKSDKRLSSSVLNSGVSGQGLAIIKSSGDKAFFGGYDTRQMKQKLGTGTKPWANRGHNVVLAGKTLANEMTSTSIEERGLSGMQNIKSHNEDNNRAVRETIHRQQGMNPEDYPAAEDTEKIKKRTERKLLN